MFDMCLGIRYGMGITFPQDSSGVRMKNAHRRNGVTRNDNRSVAQGVEACETLSLLLLPMLRQAQKEADLGAVGFLQPLLQDLGALRSALVELGEQSESAVRVN